MAKKVQIAARKPELPPEKAEPQKRLTSEIPGSLHTRLKLDCAAKRQKMVDAVREMIEARLWKPETDRDAA